MSQITDIITVHKNVQESLLKKMGDIEAQIQSAGSSKDTVARIAEEFRTFRELVFDMLKLLRSQVTECCRNIDGLEMRNRRKAVVFQGIPEEDREDCSQVMLQIINGKLGQDFPVSALKVCHRLGVHNKSHHRPILVRFSSVDYKASVWRAKTRLQGTKITVKEFLTRPRQEVFVRARQHFGMRACWTQDGNIFLKASDGSKHRVVCMEELSPLLDKYPSLQSVSQKAAGGGAGAHTVSLKSTRK
ncbi:hypothetical protein HW555_012150 [Spodoptera exigua]|uniref:Uncharacterized protein n=1 Tax=Spodoptera exigua TaxID=7107 RepID=A0A835L0Z5_SPOEX|nr:hypothetical protein HW555_012150 [Spodoptera exigua]